MQTQKDQTELKYRQHLSAPISRNNTLHEQAKKKKQGTNYRWCAFLKFPARAASCAVIRASGGLIDRKNPDVSRK